MQVFTQADFSLMGDRMPSLLVVITARGQSKGIPRKNLAIAGGHSLLWWTAKAAQTAASPDRIVLSTDDAEIAQAGKEVGLDVPFIRPAALADDTTPAPAAVINMVEWLEEKKAYRPDYVMKLQPTSPLRESGDIDAAFDLCLQKRAGVVVSAAPMHCHLSWLQSVDREGRLQPIQAQESGDASNKRQPLYVLNGAIYLAKRQVLIANDDFVDERTYAYVMPPERSIDVDSPWDLHLADLILSARSEQNRRSSGTQA